jgi:Spy/CpxP family protein refolding chaperone
MLRSTTALLLLLLSTSALAAPTGRARPPAGDRAPGAAAQRLIEALDLDAPQTEAIRGLLADAHADAEPVVARLRDDLAALKAARTGDEGVTAKVRRYVRKVALDRADLLLIRMATMDAVRDQLSPAQRKKLDELKGRRGSDEELRGEGPT